MRDAYHIDVVSASSFGAAVRGTATQGSQPLFELCPEAALPLPSNGHAGSLLAIPRPDQRPRGPRGSDGGEGRSGGAAAKGSRAEGQAGGALRGGAPVPGRRLGIGRGRFPRNGARPGPPEEPRRRGTGGGGQGKPAPGRRRRKRGAPEPPDGNRPTLTSDFN